MLRVVPPRALQDAVRSALALRRRWPPGVADEVR